MRPSIAAYFCFVVLAATGCSTNPQAPALVADDKSTHCAQLYRSIDAAVDHAEIRDGGTWPIEGYPYLRVNRFLASYQNEPLNGPQEAQWLDLMRNLDMDARALEIANLAEKERAEIALSATGTQNVADELTLCSKRLLQTDRAEETFIADLKTVMEVPDEYQEWQRVIGLYPLTALPFLQGVKDYQSERQAVFATPLSDLPVLGELTRYAPPAAPMEDAQTLQSMLSQGKQNPLGIPSPSTDHLARLFATFAPVLEIDQVDRSDQIGMPLLDRAGNPDVDTAEPMVFLRTAHTRIGDAVYLQLVYSFWFPERPASHAFDLLAGRLDGITWRVTLDRQGQPLIYDSIHNCGCYHLFIATDKLVLRESVGSFEEPILVPKELGDWHPGKRVVLRIAAQTHYVQNVRLQDQENQDGLSLTYDFLSDNRLKSLSGEGYRRYSLFRPDGIVPGTQRGERFLFWPMGVADPGAMRQWGRHATAFVGQRHFDDPRLIERYFEMH